MTAPKLLDRIREHITRCTLDTITEVELRRLLAEAADEIECLQLQDTPEDVDRWRKVLELLGGSTVQGVTEQYWSVVTPPTPHAIYRNVREEFTAAIDASNLPRLEDL